MGASNLIKKSYSTLSGGQQQRVLLARALCATNKILLLDEPVAGLDTTASADMYDLIRKLNDKGTTIIMITHHIEHVIHQAGRILDINDEKVQFLSSVEYLDKGCNICQRLSQK